MQGNLKMTTRLFPQAAPYPVAVHRSYYLTFNGKRCLCSVSELSCSARSMRFTVQYLDGDREQYALVSDDGIHYRGSKQGTPEDGRVQFDLFAHCSSILLAGWWKCGGREGRWYIEGERG